MENETCIELSGQIRRLHSIDASPWIGEGRAFWFEWNHPQEGSRNFGHITHNLTKSWGKFIKPGSTCIDIGSHSGDTTVPMGLLAFDKLRGRRGKVIAIDPNPDLQSILCATLEINSHIANFFNLNCAVTARDVDEVELSDHGNANCNGGIASAYPEKFKKHLNAIETYTYKAKGVSLETIALNFDLQNNSDQLSFIKTDCEGYDKEILLGARDFLIQVKPVIFAEWFDMFDEHEDAEFISAINSIGYIPLNPTTLEILNSREKTSDVLCIHADRLHEFK